MFEKMPPTLQEILLMRKAWLRDQLAETDRALKLLYPKYDPRANGHTESESAAPSSPKETPGKFIIEYLSKNAGPSTISKIVDAYSPGLQGKERSTIHSNLQSSVNILIEKGSVKAIPTNEGRSKYAYELVKTED